MEQVEVHLGGEDLALYQKLHVSCGDLQIARYCSRVLQKKGWHGRAWERRGAIYAQQTVFVTALVTSYSRPFTKGRGWPAIPSELVPRADGEKELHASLLALRHRVYAHSDSAEYQVDPRKLSNGLSVVVLSEPQHRLTKEELVLFDAMTARLLSGFAARMDQLWVGGHALLNDLSEV